MKFNKTAETKMPKRLGNFYNFRLFCSFSEKQNIAAIALAKFAQAFDNKLHYFTIEYCNVPFCLFIRLIERRYFLAKNARKEKAGTARNSTTY